MEITSGHRLDRELDRVLSEEGFHARADFQGSIPEGEYGGGTTSLWDIGTYETEKWWEDEITVSLKGQSGNWLIFRCGTDG